MSILDKVIFSTSFGVVSGILILRHFELYHNDLYVAIGLILPPAIIFMFWYNFDEDRKENIRRIEEENQRNKEKQEKINRIEREKQEKEDAEERAFQKQLDRERRTLEMRRSVDLKFSIEERLQNLKITEYNRAKVREMEKELEGATSTKLNELYEELNRLEGK